MSQTLVKPVEEPLTKSVNGNEIFRSNLRVVSLFGGFMVIDTDNCAVLTIGYEVFHVWINEPYLFEDEEKARAWISHGTIGELQEAHTNLAIVFTNQLAKPAKWQTDSKDPYYQEKKYG